MGIEKKKNLHQAFKFHLYPPKEQAILMNKSIGCNRYVFNHLLTQLYGEYGVIGTKDGDVQDGKDFRRHDFWTL